MICFGGIEKEYCIYNNASFLLQPIPYDATSTWGKGSDKGFKAFIEATENMELYDIETDTEAYTHGIHILPKIIEHGEPEKMVQKVYDKAKEMLRTDKFPTFYGGEHSISIGIMRAFAESYPDLTVLQLDAHADLRSEYLGSPYNHACAMHEISKSANLIQVGIRSMDKIEKQFMDTSRCFFAEEMYRQNNWMQESISLMTEKVYLTIDLDVLNPSIMPSTGTPEPGGPDWDITIQFLRKVFQQKTVVGFDIVEHAPIEGLKAPDFLVAKLYYKLLSYKIKEGYNPIKVNKQ